jgi:hypothetical protein
VLLVAQAVPPAHPWASAGAALTTAMNPLVLVKQRGNIPIRSDLFYSVFLNHMPHFSGHTHTKHTRRDSNLADRGGFPEPDNVLEREVRVTPDILTAHAGRSAPTHSAIAELAYSYWEARGCRGGSEWEDWFRAESELQERSRR